MSAASYTSEMVQEDKGLPWQKAAVALVLAAVLGLAAWWLVKMMKADTSGPKRQVVKIAVLPDTPPPPPPPKEEKKIEPEKKELQPQQQQEQPKPQEAPPEPQQLKMDGPAGDGPSAFAAGQVKSEYKGGEIGTGSGVNKLQFALFTSRLTKFIQAELARNKDLKGLDYKVSVRLWMSADGHFQKVELLTPLSSDEQSALLTKALNQLPPLDQVPGNLPQPLTLRITNRVIG